MFNTLMKHGGNVIIHRIKDSILSSFVQFRNQSADGSLTRFNYNSLCENGVNKQINMELQCFYTYLTMAHHFNQCDVALPGFYHYFLLAAEEEYEHAKKFMKYQIRRGGKLAYSQIEAPPKSCWRPDEAFSDSICLEKQVTQSLLDLHACATAHGDAHLPSYIESEYLNEQYKTIRKLSAQLTQIKRAGEGVGLLIIDKQLQPK